MSALFHPLPSRRFLSLHLPAAVFFFCACLMAQASGMAYADGFSGSSGNATGINVTPPAPQHQQQGSFHGNSGETQSTATPQPATQDPAKTFANEPANAQPASASPPAAPTSGTTAQTSAEQPSSDVPAPPPDPCAAFMASYNDYVMCQDRYQKIERMRNAQKQRDSAYQAPAPVATPAPAPAPDKKADDGLPPNKYSAAYQQEQAKKEAAEKAAEKAAEDKAKSDAGTGTDNSTGSSTAGSSTDSAATPADASGTTGTSATTP